MLILNKFHAFFSLIVPIYKYAASINRTIFFNDDQKTYLILNLNTNFMTRISWPWFEDFKIIIRNTISLFRFYLLRAGIIARSKKAELISDCVCFWMTQTENFSYDSKSTPIFSKNSNNQANLYTTKNVYNSSEYGLDKSQIYSPHINVLKVSSILRVHKLLGILNLVNHDQFQKAII